MAIYDSEVKTCTVVLKLSTSLIVSRVSKARQTVFHYFICTRVEIFFERKIRSKLCNQNFFNCLSNFFCIYKLMSVLHDTWTYSNILTSLKPAWSWIVFPHQVLLTIEWDLSHYYVDISHLQYPRQKNGTFFMLRLLFCMDVEWFPVHW